MMKFIVSFVILVTLFSQDVAGTRIRPAQCSGGQADFWRIGCNWCHCVRGIPDCEDKSCTRAELAWAKCTGECIGRGSWKKQCNRCSCSRGRAVCTKKFCIPTGPSSCSEFDRAKCPEYRMIDYMRVKGCKPVYPRNPRRGCCATHFRCERNFAKPTDGRCLYKGAVVPNGFRLEESVGCLFGCRCSRSRFFCAQPRCARPQGFERGCKLTYTLNGCCPSGVVCPKDDPHQCKWNGKTFLEKERMTFEQAGYSCQKCICNKDFKNPFDGNKCQKIDCSYDLRTSSQDRILKGCVPIFNGTRCCPWEYLCPEDEKVDTTQDDAVSRPRGKYCKFGGFKIPLGKKLSVTDRDVTCKCVAPPDVLCVRNRIEPV